VHSSILTRETSQCMCATVQTLPHDDDQIGGVARGFTLTLRVEHDGTESGLRGNAEIVGAAGVPMQECPLVMGFGNVLLRDDGAGVQLMQRLRSELTSSPCEFVDAGTMSFSLLSYVESTNSMLVLDAAELAAPPGTIVLLEGSAMDNFLKSVRRRTVHEVGLIDLLDMARMEDSLPKRRALLCVQPGEIHWGETLSPAVTAALPRALEMACDLLGRWLGS
jgi:hydrogenase maturation protease